MRSIVLLVLGIDGNLLVKKQKIGEVWFEGFIFWLSEEKLCNCKLVDLGIVSYIVQMVFDVLLESIECEIRQLEDGRVWRKGGKQINF